MKIIDKPITLPEVIGLVLTLGVVIGLTAWPRANPFENANLTGHFQLPYREIIATTEVFALMYGLNAVFTRAAKRLLHK